MSQIVEKWAAPPILRLVLSAKAANFTALNGFLYLVTPAAASTVNVTLPTSPYASMQIAIKDMGGDLQDRQISINRAGGILIDGVDANLAMSSEFETIYLISDGTNWFRI